MLYNISPETFSFRDTHRRQMAQGINDQIMDPRLTCSKHFSYNLLTAGSRRIKKEK
jgi:hypothetical protein